MIVVIFILILFLINFLCYSSSNIPVWIVWLEVSLKYNNNCYYTHCGVVLCLLMQNSTDEQLVALALDGQHPALDMLVERYLKLVYSFVHKYIRDDADAQDVTQEIFVRVWQHLEKFDSAKSFRPWLYTIAKNACLDFLRRKSHVPFSSKHPFGLKMYVVSPFCTTLSPSNAI